MHSAQPPLDAGGVALRLGVRPSTLNGWLAADEERSLQERRFHFHTYRGRKRVWSETAYVDLERAIERESEPGGVLGGWRNAADRTIGPDQEPAARAALDRVLSFRHDAPEEEADGGEDQAPPLGAP